MKTETYFRKPDAADSVLDRIMDGAESGNIPDDLSYALAVAVYHQFQVDYDAMQRAYESGDATLRQLMEDSGVIILLTEEQTKAVKYGV